jgi:septum formation protein
MLLDRLKEYSIVLASQSPRRRELLAGLGLRFEIDGSEIPEILPADVSPCLIVEDLARQKTEAIAGRYNLQKTIIIGGDTLVCLDNHIMGKPAGRKEAITMLHELSGRKHTVVSGLCLIHKNRCLCKHDCTLVYFKPLTHEEITYYVDSFQPFDKAGAYGIQEWIGYQAIKYIEGSFYTVVGLPTHLVWTMLEEIMCEVDNPE